MDQSTKQAFTRRITTSNASELIVVLYDIFFTYTDDAKKAFEECGTVNESVKESIRHATKVLRHLKDDLDFKYEISKNLFSIYDFCERSLTSCLYKRDREGILIAERLMKKLYGSFLEVAKQDKSAPLMKNTQKMAAGLTYGRNDVIETILMNPSRGYLA
ncbi:MAG: flagellar protein FliS [Lachnospiraceae bacterium]|nr:flagellar protein FliS [Lachnospiraceae bacterium]